MQLDLIVWLRLPNAMILHILDLWTHDNYLQNDMDLPSIYN